MLKSALNMLFVSVTLFVLFVFAVRWWFGRFDKRCECLCVLMRICITKTAKVGIGVSDIHSLLHFVFVIWA